MRGCHVWGYQPTGIARSFPDRFTGKQGGGPVSKLKPVDMTMVHYVFLSELLMVVPNSKLINYPEIEIIP
jgi:hypothetical protein